MQPRSEWWQRRASRRRSGLLLPIAVGAIQILGANAAAQRAGVTIEPLGYALLVLGPAALVTRRAAPLAALGVTLAATVGYVALGDPLGPVFLAPLVAAVGAVRRTSRPAVWALCALAYAAYLTLTPAQPLGTRLLVGAGVIVALLVAETIRVRAAQIAELARARAEASRARQEQSRRQASEERLRIARELHDVLGHHLSLINVRAGVALHLLDDEPDQARDALAAIKQASAEALREVRGVLSALSDDDRAPRSPAPRLADVDQLVEEARSAGLPVEVRRDGALRPLPAGVDRAAYRIVQEALTNVRRHAGPGAHVIVHIGLSGSELSLLVTDDGIGPQPSTEDSQGNGIPGMRERAAALGGTLVAGSAEGGGFRVRATLPLPPNDPPEESS